VHQSALTERINQRRIVAALAGAAWATAKARKMVEEMRRKGDYDGADTWLRIIVAIGERRAAD